MVQLGSASTSLCSWDILVSASPCQRSGVGVPFGGVTLMVMHVGSGMVLCGIGPPVAVSIEWALSPGS